MVSGVGAVDGLFAVNLDHAAVLNVPRVLQLIEDVTGLVFDQQSCAGRPEESIFSKTIKPRMNRRTACQPLMSSGLHAIEAARAGDAADGGLTDHKSKADDVRLQVWEEEWLISAVRRCEVST